MPRCAAIAFVLLVVIDLSFGAFASSKQIRPYKHSEQLASFGDVEEDPQGMAVGAISDVEFEGPDLYGEISGVCMLRWYNQLSS
jgi:hypothetical protein